MTILESGSCEAFKGAVHAAALSLAALMGLYNLAAWMQRREPHLAVNAIVYMAAIAFESQHVNHHRLSALEVAAQAAALAAAANAASAATPAETAREAAARELPPAREATGCAEADKAA